MNEENRMSKMRKVLLLFGLVLVLLSSCSSNPVKILVKDISMGGTGDNYNVSPAKVEVEKIGLNKVVMIPITITNKDIQIKTFQLKIVSPLIDEVSQGYTPYPISGVNAFFNQDTVTVNGGGKETVNFYIAKVDKIPDTQVWVNVSVETNNQITSAYIVNILIKGDNK
jgi:hypothetical protein